MGWGVLTLLAGFVLIGASAQRITGMGFALPADCAVTSVVGHGKSLQKAVQGLDFEDSEVVLIGSSRLAQPKRLFLGHSASKIMRALPVPMIVWPRD